MTPRRLVELECPECHEKHWEIDSDYRGSLLIHQREQRYGEREYKCPTCQYSGSGYQPLAKSPPEFLIQPHPMYPMIQADFDYWVCILRMHFPDHPLLEKLGREFRPNTDMSTKD